MSLEALFLIDYLKKFDENPFLVAMDGKDYLIGDGAPTFKVFIKKPINKVELLTSTSLALGEAYMRGDIEIEGDLFQALDMLLEQMGKFTTDKKSLKKLIYSATSQKNQSKEVQSHYDIGNHFYEMWLDETMSYSCAFFKNESDTLTEAQKNKVKHTLGKMDLKEGMTLLDIGCGWGYLLIEAAKNHGVKGTGITLSKEQFEKCKQNIVDEKLEDLVSVQLMDYRELENSGLLFDRVVSVGMLEHVGRPNYELFIKNVNAVLNDGGIFLLHYISALQEHPGDPWIKKYIFPGGTIPSLREMIHICGDYHFYTIDVESLRRHYMKTLLCWRENYLPHKEQVKKEFGEEFTRMWELYLCSCAATFHNGIIDVHQLVLSKGVNNEYPMLVKRI